MKKVLQKVGLQNKNIDLKNITAKDKLYNLLVVYIESFNSSYTKAGGRKISGLTPNIDNFIKDSVFF